MARGAARALGIAPVRKPDHQIRAQRERLLLSPWGRPAHGANSQRASADPNPVAEHQPEEGAIAPHRS
jgi:hypothetical protein